MLERPDENPTRAWIAWLVILLCVGYVAWHVQRAYQNASKMGMENPSAELQVHFVGKALIGMKRLPGGDSAPNQEQMIRSLDQYATSPLEKIRVATVIAEVKGPNEALDEIEKLQADPKVKSSPVLEEDLWALRRIYTSGLSSLDEASKQRLIDRHGFFGKLAGVYGLPDKDPARSALLDDARNAAIRMFAMTGIALALFVVALAAVITAIVLAALGMLKPLYVRQSWANSAYVEGFAIYIALFLGFELVVSKLKLESLGWYWIAIVLIPVVMLWIRSSGVPAPEMRRGLGWYWGKGPWIEIPLGIFGYFAGLPVLVAGFFITSQLIKHAHASPMHPIERMLRGDKWQVLALYGIACVFAPIIEETMFRGALFNHMRRRWNWLISAGVVALLFASIHPQGWTLIPALGSIAIVLAAIREWRGAIWGSMAAHATNNFIVLSLALMVAR